MISVLPQQEERHEVAYRALTRHRIGAEATTDEHLRHRARCANECTADHAFGPAFVELRSLDFDKPRAFAHAISSWRAKS